MRWPRFGELYCPDGEMVEWMVECKNVKAHEEIDYKRS